MNYLTARTRDFPSLLNDVFFKDVFGDDFYNSLPSLKKINYPVDIYETDDGLVLDIAAIGLDKKDINIDIKDQVISVSHNKKEDKKDDKYAYRGITQKSFSLAWKINDKFDLTKTKANLNKGLLKITIPVAPDKKPNNIEITIN
jgi:HSP20 family protein